MSRFVEDQCVRCLYVFGIVVSGLLLRVYPLASACSFRDSPRNS